jgi:type IV pilus assembly protein PilV
MPAMMRARQHRPAAQTGSLLLEAFIAILIFSMGILAIVGMWASAIKSATDAKYRADASLLANELIGQMWVTDRIGANLQANFDSTSVSNVGYTNWYSNVVAALPGAAANPPVVSVNPATGLVTVSIQWKVPSEGATAPPHGYSAIAQIQ